MLAVEDQILNGTNTSPEIQGMITCTGIQAQAWDTDILATTRKAITLVELINYPTSGLCFGFSPEDWETLELVESTGGAYKMNDGSARAPINRQKRTLWGVPVCLSTSLTEGEGVLFHRDAVTLFEHMQGVRIDWSEAPDSNVAKNEVTWRCEGRWSAAIHAPEGIVSLELAASTGS